MPLYVLHWPFSSVVKYNAIGAGNLGFDFQGGQFGHSVAKGSPPLLRFFRSCVAQALSRGDVPNN